MAPQKKDPPPLLTLRSTVVFSAAAMAAGVSGIGTYAGHVNHSPQPWRVVGCSSQLQPGWTSMSAPSSDLP